MGQLPFGARRPQDRRCHHASARLSVSFHRSDCLRRTVSDVDHSRWQNLTETPYKVSFESSATAKKRYPTAMIRTSISGISEMDQLSFTLNDQPVDLSSGFPDTDAWRGSRDRRWIEAHISDDQISSGENIIMVHLTEKGRETDEPQGGKMITSVEVIQYGEASRFNGTQDFIGAFPTFDEHKKMTLRPVSRPPWPQLLAHIHSADSSLDQRELLDASCPAPE